MADRPTITSSTTPYKHVLTTSGTPSTDDAAFAAVLAAHQPGEPIWIKGDFHLTGQHTITDPCTIAGFDKNSRLIMAPTAQVNFGAYYSTSSDGTLIQPITPFSGREETFASAGLGASIGDLVICLSDDVLTGFPWHDTPYEPRSSEMMEIKGIASNGEYQTDMGFADVYLTNPRCGIITPLRGCGLKDLRVTGDGNTAVGTARSFRFNKCAGLEITGCHFETLGPGGLHFTECYNAIVSNNEFGIAHRWDQGEGYWLVVCGGNGFLASTNHFNSSRHVITTGNSGGDASFRSGTVRNFIFSDNVVRQSGYLSTNSGLVVVDCHSEGYELCVHSNLIEIGPRCTSPAFNSRARRTMVMNNVIRSTGTDTFRSNAKGGYLVADGSICAHNTFSGLWHGPEIRSLSGHTPTGCRVFNNVFEQLAGPGVYVTGGNEHVIEGNTFYDCANQNTSRSEADIQFTNNSLGTSIQGNVMSKKAGSVKANSIDLGPIVEASDVIIAGNTMGGYGSGSMGMTGANAIEVSNIEAKWYDKNTTWTQPS